MYLSMIFKTCLCLLKTIVSTLNLAVAITTVVTLICYLLFLVLDISICNVLKSIFQTNLPVLLLYFRMTVSGVEQYEKVFADSMQLY